MFEKDFLELIEDRFDFDDILNILGQDKMWLLLQIKDELLKHKQEFFSGDESYSEIYDG